MAILGGDHVTCAIGKQICKRPKIRQKAGAGDRQTWKWFLVIRASQFQFSSLLTMIPVAA